MIDDSNLISTKSFNNNQTQNLQQNLMRMGFDLIMINKIISIFKIQTENEAIDYLIKSDDGMWNHPFIPKEINPDEENNVFLDQPKAMMNNVLTRINSLGISNSIKERTSNLLQNDSKSGEIRIEEDICEICGESKNFHKIKDYLAPVENNSTFRNDNYSNDIILNNNNNNILNDEDKNILLVKDNIMNNDQNNNIQKEEKKEEEEDINPNECPICMGDFENPIEIEKCKHKFCQECFNSYLVNLINNNRIDEIACPKKNCSNKKLPEEFFSQYLSEQEYYKYRQFRAQNDIARDSKKIFCPLCDSYAQIEGITEKYDSNNPNYKKSTLKCQKGHEFCSCGRPLHENDCYHDEKEFKEFLESEKIKKCPKCGFLIKKNKGCNHMTCGNPICRYEFCWLCMKEAIPNHFEYGPCAGKQFYDPDSFSYRLQQTHPCLYCIFSLFQCLFVFLSIIIGFLAVPAFGLTFIAFGVISESDSLAGNKNKFIRRTLYLICFCVSLCIQSIAYIAWACIFAIIGIIVSFVIVSLVFSLITKILRCIFCCTCFTQESVDINFEANDIELGNNNNEGNN
jgi:hypothetical protein